MLPYGVVRSDVLRSGMEANGMEWDATLNPITIKPEAYVYIYMYICIYTYVCVYIYIYTRIASLARVVTPAGPVPQSRLLKDWHQPLPGFVV